MKFPSLKEALEHAINLAYRSGVAYAYIENIFERSGKNTYCPACRHILIEREGYGIVSWEIKDKRCPKCGKAIPVVGEPLLATLPTR
ncbi:MAG: hypothetical protein ACE5HY_00750 [Candidatus Hydrothermarchaeales archaeon]